jgi:hypothetical protein
MFPLGLVFVTSLELAAGAFGCADVLGIDTAECDPAFSRDCACRPGQDQCDCYCSRVEDACTGDNAVYLSPEACRAMCPVLLAAQGVGEELLDCRINRAFQASSAPDGDRPALCSAAGPSGQSRDASLNCGSDPCVAYCGSMNRVCSTNALSCIEDCQQRRADDLEFDQLDYRPGLTGDTLQCRVYHVNNAAESAAAGAMPQVQLHCGHAFGAPPCATTPVGTP